MPPAMHHCVSDAVLSGVDRAGQLAVRAWDTFAVCVPWIGNAAYPVRLGRNPIAMAMMASIVTTRMAAANISTSFGMAQFSPMTGALV